MSLRLQLREGAVEVGRGEEKDGVGALGHHLGDGAALVVGDAGVDGRRMEHDRRARLSGRADGDPAHLAGADVEAHLEAQDVTVEGQGLLRIVMGEEGRVDGEIHADQTKWGSASDASRFLTGLVTCFATQDGIPAVPFAA